MHSTHSNGKTEAKPQAFIDISTTSSLSQTVETVRILLKESDHVSSVSDGISVGTGTALNRNTLIENWNKLWSSLSPQELLSVRLCFIYFCEILSPIPHSLTKSSNSQGFIPVLIVKLLWSCVISRQPDSLEDEESVDKMVDTVLQILISKFGFFIKETITLQINTTSHSEKVKIECVKFSNKLFKEYGIAMKEKQGDEHQIRTEDIKKEFAKNLLKEIGDIDNNDFISLKGNFEYLLNEMHEGKLVIDRYCYAILCCCHLFPCITLKSPAHYLLEPKFTQYRIDLLGIHHGTSIAVSDMKTFSNTFENDIYKIQAFEVIASCIHAALMDKDDQLDEQMEISIEAAHAFMEVAKISSTMSHNPSKYYREALAMYEEILDNHVSESKRSQKKVIMLDMADVMQKLGNHIAHETSGLLIEDIGDYSNRMNGKIIPNVLTPLNYEKYENSKLKTDHIPSKTKGNDANINHESMELFDRVFQIRRVILGAQHLLVANTIHCVGLLYFEANLHQNALGCFTEALRIRRTSFSSNALLRRQDSTKTLVSRDLELSIAETLEWIGICRLELKDYESAITTFNEALIITSIHYPKDHEGIAALYQKIGNLQYKLGKYKASTLQFSEALRARRLCYHNSENNKIECMKNLIETLSSLGDVYWKLNDSSQALSFYLEGMDLQKAILHECITDYQILSEIKDDAHILPLPMYIHFSTSSPSSENGANLTTFASTSYIDDRLQNIIRTTPELYSYIHKLFNLTSNIIELSILKYGEDHPEVSILISKAADLYIQTGNYKKAIKCFNEVLRIMALCNDREEKNRQLIINAMNRVAFCYARTCDINNSISYYENLLNDLDEEMKSVDAFFDMISSYEEGFIISGEDSFEEMESILERFIFGHATTVDKSFKSPIIGEAEPPKMEHLILISNIFYKLANAQYSIGSYDSAFSILFYSLMIRLHCFQSGKSKHENPSEVELGNERELLVHFLDAYLSLVICYVFVTGNFERVRNVIECEILPLYEQSYGKTNQNHVSIGHTCYYLGQMYQGLAVFGQSSLDVEGEGSSECFMDKALEFYNRAMEIYLKNFDNDNILFGHVHLSIGSIYDSRSLFTEAIDHFTNTLRVYRKFNENGQHLGVAIVLNSLGISCTMNGSEKEGLEYFKMSYEVRKALFGDHHTMVSDSLFNMAGVYAKLGMFSDSRDCYEKCLKIRLETCSDDNLLVAKTYHDLAIVHAQLKNHHVAIIYLEKELCVLHSNLPPNSEKIASAYYHIGNMQALVENNEKAVGCYRKSLHIYKTQHDENSSIIAKITLRIKALDAYEMVENSNDEDNDEVVNVKSDPHLELY